MRDDAGRELLVRKCSKKEGKRESFLCGTIRGLFGVVSGEDPRTKDPRRGVRMYVSRVAFPWLRCYPEASSVFTLMKHIEL